MSVRLTFAPLAAGLLLSACGASATAPDTQAGPVAQALSAAAQQSGVPRDLLVAIAAEEGGLRLAPHRTLAADDHVPVAGYLELRHGKRDTLTRGALLAGTDLAGVVEDTSRGTEAGAAVLAEIGKETGATSDLSTWQPALEELSGLSGSLRVTYARNIINRLHDGGAFPAWGGETVRLDAHPDLFPGGALPEPATNTPQFPGAQWFTTSCTNKCGTSRTQAIDTIVIHDTEGGWTASVATLQNDPAKSVHYIVDADGSRVGQFLDESYDAWHAGNSVFNNRSIGIEHVGFADDANGYSDELYVTSAKLVENIRSRNDIPLDRAHIIGHYQVPDGTQISSSSPPCSDPLASCELSVNYGGSNNHRDPGLNWQWCQYMQRLGGSCECNDAHAHFNCTTDRTQAVRCVNGEVEIKNCASACVTEATGEDDSCDATTTPTPTDGGSAIIPISNTYIPPTQPIITTSTPSTSGNAKPFHAGCNVTGASATGDLAVIALMMLGLCYRRRKTA